MPNYGAAEFDPPISLVDGCWAAGLRAISVRCTVNAIDASHEAVIFRESGVSSTPQILGSIVDVSEYWIARFRGR
jgi:hypothetical protein